MRRLWTRNKNDLIIIENTHAGCSLAANINNDWSPSLFYKKDTEKVMQGRLWNLPFCDFWINESLIIEVVSLSANVVFLISNFATGKDGIFVMDIFVTVLD